MHFKHATSKKLAFREQEFSLLLLHNHSTLQFYHSPLCSRVQTLPCATHRSHAAQDKSVPVSELQCSANLLQFIETAFLPLFVGVFVRTGISNSTHTSSCFADSVSFLKTLQRWFSIEKFRKYTNSNYKEKYCEYKGVALHSLVLWTLFIHTITFPLLSMQWSTMWSLLAKHSTGHYISLKALFWHFL